MSRGTPKYSNGPQNLIAGVELKGGQLVMFGSGGTVGQVIVATADTPACIGVVITDAEPASAASTGTDTFGFPYVSAAVPGEVIAVGQEGVFLLKAAATIAAGAAVKVAAAGTVTTFVDGTDASLRRVGRCVDPAGIASGALGLVKLTL